MQMNTVLQLGLLLAYVICTVDLCRIIECRYVNPRIAIEVIDPTLCTHLVYGDFYITEKIVYPNNVVAKSQMPVFSRINALKKKNTQLKTTIIIKPDRQDDFFFKMYKDATLKKQFVVETVRFLREINFDGIQINMRSYNGNDAVLREKSNLVMLMKDLSEAFTAEYLKSKKPKLILSLTPQAEIKGINEDYDIVGISKYVDYLSVYTGMIAEKNTNTFFRHQSPLYGEDDSDSHSLDYFARYLLTKGVEKQKLVFGVDLSGNYYLHGWSSFFPDYKSMAYLDYKEVCERLKNRIPLFDEAGMVPYFKTKTDGLMYNDQYSLRIKVIYIKSHGFGGVSNSAIIYDDYEGACNKGKFPLSTAIREECSV